MQSSKEDLFSAAVGQFLLEIRTRAGNEEQSGKDDWMLTGLP